MYAPNRALSLKARPARVGPSQAKCLEPMDCARASDHVTNATIPAVHLAAVSRHFGEVKALDAINLDISDGEFFSMLGPSGSGKTTCLRLIAGFDRPTLGRIELHGQDVTDLPPYERSVNTVFQDYALFPHMTVGQNVAYGLMIKKVSPAERERRVADLLDLVKLSGMEKRRPSHRT